MPLPDNLLNPIPGENPSGEDLRYTPLYDQIKEARREEEETAQGEWVHEVKKADYPLVIKLSTDAIASKSKDLQLGAWLTDALLRVQGFPGLLDGLQLLQNLTVTFWDTVYPQLEDGDAEFRATPLQWVGTSLSFPLRAVPLNRAGHGWLEYTESRKIPLEEQADTEEKANARRVALAEGKLAPEVFDKSFVETPKAFYAGAESTLDNSIKTLESFDSVCSEKFGDAAPSFMDLKKTLQEVRHTVHMLLQKKRETDPDPVEPGAAMEGAASEPGAPGAEGTAAVETRGRVGGGAVAGIVIPFADKEPAERREAIAAIARGAAALRKLDPCNPAPYLMMRGLRWGELRAALGRHDMTLLEAPPTDLRQHVKRLAIEGKWNDLLEATENSMSLPCSRAWLDLHKFALDACAGLGTDYSCVAVAIRNELKALVRDLPQVLEISLLDDTPAANAETKTWLRQLVEETPIPAAEGAPAEDGAPPEDGAPTAQVPVINNHFAPGWHRKFADSYDLANEALRAGQPEKAIETMMREVERQLSGRGQFFRKLQLAEICIAAGKAEIAQPIIEDLAAAIENNHLETWESPKIIAKALVSIIKNSQRVQADDSEKLRLFHKVIRLDPVQAIHVGT